MSMRHSTEAIAVHCTASKFGVSQSIKQIREEHIARGFSDIGYHFVIALNGSRMVGRSPAGCVGSHVRGFNDRTIGVSYVGGLSKTTSKQYPDGIPTDTRTPGQTKELIALIKDLLLLYPHAVILGHRDLSPDLNHDGIIEPNEWMKVCPCFDAAPWADSVVLPGGKYVDGKFKLTNPQFFTKKTW